MNKNKIHFFIAIINLALVRVIVLPLLSSFRSHVLRLALNFLQSLFGTPRLPMVDFTNPNPPFLGQQMETIKILSFRVISRDFFA